MDNQSIIFWFSGTGNSLYAAKQLSSNIRARLVQITNFVPSGVFGSKDVKIGFVFPSYYGNLPRAVRAFVDKLEINPDTYIFAVVTMGGVGQGSVGALNKALKQKGLRLNYGRGIHMPANYVIKYNPADPLKSAKALDKADGCLRKIAAEITARTQAAKTLPVTANNLYKKIAELDTEFTVSNGCSGCGRCEKICPVKNIRIENKKPIWLNHCEHCVACISWCPANAIDYGSKTQSRRRYCNLRIKAEELIKES